jgi:hypothetical protein
VVVAHLKQMVKPILAVVVVHLKELVYLVVLAVQVLS